VTPDGTAKYVISGETSQLGDREYVMKALKGEKNISGVLISKVTGEPVVMEASPIISNGEVVGVLLGRRDGTFLSTITDTQGIGERGYAFILGADSTIYAHLNKDMVVEQRNIFSEIESDGPLKAYGLALKELGLGTEGMVNYEMDGDKRMTAMAPVPNTDWTIGIANYESDVLAGVNALRNILIILSLVVVAVGIVASFVIGNMISKPIVNLRNLAKKLAVGDIDVNVETKLTDEVGDLTIAFGEMIENIKNQADAASRIAAGDLSTEVTPRSEQDILGKSMQAVVGTLRNLVSETEHLSHAAVEGQLSTRGQADRFKGAYYEIINGFNVTLDAVIGPLNVAADYMDRISKGDIPPVIEEEYKGDFDLIKENINTCIGAVNGMVEDMNALSKEVVKGNLLNRADAGKHSGDFARIIEGVNLTLDTLVGFLNEMPAPVMIMSTEYDIQYINKIGAEIIGSTQDGLLGTKCYDGFKTDHCKTENCACANAMRLNERIDAETEAHPNGMTLDISYTGIPIKDENNKIIGALELVVDQSLVKMAARVADKREVYQKIEVEKLIHNLGKIADGNLDITVDIGATDADTEFIGKNYEKINDSLKQSTDSLKAMMADIDLLAQAAVDGKLDTRAEADKHRGDYKKIVQGVNGTLDAIIEPIKEAAEVLKEMANGNLQVMVKGDYKGDHAELKNAVNETIGSIVIYISEISTVLTEMGEGNLNQVITAEYKGDFVQIKDSLNSILDSLNQVMGDIGEASDQVASGSRQVSDGSQALSQGSTEQASSIQELTASIIEIASQTKQNAINASQANELATTARDNAEQGNQQMKAMLVSMEEINDSSANISKIIKVIDDIAFQTNILALNAAVEAARAGQHGKGFAVVAEEVRNLAARSAAAARETTDLIEGSIHKVQGGTKMANETAQALEGIVSGVEKAASLVGGIAEASNEQASGIAQINKGIEQVSQVVQNNAATAEESAAASEELSSQAELLKDMVSRFKLNNGAGSGKMRLLGGQTEKASNSSKGAKEAKPTIILNNDEYDKY